ncbi:hypothetical protein CDO44_03055 [Pigmentiphaga sp. NML080357]|nr:putative zinc-binding protein [Accumulibacter sp.]OVZ63798.1 hypothetical protein CDO44_03055 [Pigmentiphaga sp. NML080357]
MANNQTPLVYSCSGCSSAAQMTNHLALQLDRLGLAEMSCIAGVGGGVPALVKTATSGRPILALDGFEHLDVLLGLRRHPLVALGLDLQGARTQLRRFAFLGAQEPGA